jgi:hypothetical protein
MNKDCSNAEIENMLAQIEEAYNIVLDLRNNVHEVFDIAEVRIKDFDKLYDREKIGRSLEDIIGKSQQILKNFWDIRDDLEIKKGIDEIPTKEDKNIKVLDGSPEHEVKVSRSGELPGAYSIEFTVKKK